MSFFLEPDTEVHWPEKISNEAVSWRTKMAVGRSYSQEGDSSIVDYAIQWKAPSRNGRFIGTPGTIELRTWKEKCKLQRGNPGGGPQ